jgi:benzylsuccinate CoA-transferase BbsE subunit
LAGVRVLDLTSAIGAYCTRTLGDLGADVIKVEHPEGDAYRTRPPLAKSASGSQRSLIFETYNLNKRGITLDMANEGAVPLLDELGRTADVIVLSPTPRQPVAGFDPEGKSLAWAREDAILAAITPFGLTGPLRNWRSTPYLSYAMGGGMHRAGKAGGPPLGIPGQQQWDEAGLYGAIAVLGALRSRPSTGGQLLDLAVHEVAFTKDYMIPRYDVDGMAEWGRSVLVGFPPTGTWQCRDGSLDISCYQAHHWGAFLQMVDNPPELADPELNQALVRRQKSEELIKTIAELLAPRSRLELFAKGQKAGLPCSPLYLPGDFVSDEQPRARGLFAAVEAVGLGEVKLPWGIFKSSPTLLQLRRPAPRLGEHNYEVYVEELGHANAEIRAWEESELV